LEGKYGKIVEHDGRPYCDGKELASLLDITKGRVSQLTSDGTFFRDDTEDGKLYDMHFCSQAYYEKLSQSTNAEDTKIRRDRAKAETSIKASKAVIANLEAQELKGKMFRVEDIRAITEQYFYEIRNMINALPGQLATDVAASDNAAECAVIIRTCVNRLLMNMQKYRFDVAKYKERVHDRMSWEDAKDDSDGGEE
jgi:phage terminase Nu1 subunit (DNA packaging protein)